MKEINYIHENNMLYLYWGGDFYDSYYTEEEMNIDIKYLEWVNKTMSI